MQATLHRGPKFKSQGPVSRVAVKLGMSMPEIARAMGVEYETLKSWNHRNTVPLGYLARLVKLTERRLRK